MKKTFCHPALFLLILLFLCSILPALAAPGDEPESVEERRIKTSIRQEVNRLRQKEEMLNLRETELKTLQQEVDKKIEELKTARVEITALLEKKKELETEKTRELGKMYEKMEPAVAAGLLSTLEKQLAIAILESMSPKKAGKILDNMDRETAAALSTSYSKLP
jgi:flagellar motility protein MotE (MotC chaperone)